MSKTKRKAIRVGICNGSNTSFYRDRRKRQRRINAQKLRAASNSLIIDEDIDDVMYLKIPKKDDWREPTDGSILIEKEDLERYGKNKYVSKRQYDKLHNKLKPKHYKH